MMGDAVNVTVVVPVAPDAAFRIFTEETDLWWRQGPRFRVAGREPGVVIFDPREGGRLLESFETKVGTRVVELGRITAWEPGVRLAFEWRAVNFGPEEKTLVEVNFQPVSTGSKVTVLHSGWASLRANHPVRHGEDVAAFIRRRGMWWGDLMASFRESSFCESSFRETILRK